MRLVLLLHLALIDASRPSTLTGVAAYPGRDCVVDLPSAQQMVPVERRHASLAARWEHGELVNRFCYCESLEVCLAMAQVRNHCDQFRWGEAWLASLPQPLEPVSLARVSLFELWIKIWAGKHYELDLGKH